MMSYDVRSYRTSSCEQNIMLKCSIGLLFSAIMLLLMFHTGS